MTTSERSTERPPGGPNDFVNGPEESAFFDMALDRPEPLS